MLSFGYQVLWNHLLALIELRDLTLLCMSASRTERHAVQLDLVEEFRAPIVDSLVLWLVNRKIMDAQNDFVHRHLSQ